MPHPEEIHGFLKGLFERNREVEISITGRYIDLRAYPGNYDGKDWEVNFNIDMERIVLPKPSYWSAFPDDVFHYIGDTGDVPPEEVVSYAAEMSRRLQDSGFALFGLTDLEREAIKALHGVVMSWNGNDHDALKNAIASAQAITSRYFENTHEAGRADEPDTQTPRL